MDQQEEQQQRPDQSKLKEAANQLLADKGQAHLNRVLALTGIALLGRAIPGAGYPQAAINLSKLALAWVFIALEAEGDEAMELSQDSALLALAFDFAAV